MDVANTLSERIMQISPSATNESNKQKAELENQGISVINLSSGDISYSTPDVAKTTAAKALADDDTKYTLAAGRIELREAIASQYKRKFALDYSPEQVLVGSGTKNVIFTLFGAICNPGDEVILPVPCWPSYPEQIKLFGGIPKIVKCGIENGFKMTPSMLEDTISSKTKAIIINSSSNPSGVVYTKTELEALAKIIEKHDALILFDDVYSTVLADKTSFYNIANVSDNIKEKTIIAGGISKNYGMTGWRLGWLLGSEEIISATASFQSHSLGAAATISQAAALSVINAIDECPFREGLNKRRHEMLNCVSKIPELQYIKPEGACYFYPSIKQIIGKKYKGEVLRDSKQFCNLALRDKHILMIPGEGFGLAGYVRLSFGNLTLEQIDEGMGLLKEFVNAFE